MKTLPEFPLERMLEIKSQPQKFRLLEVVPAARHLLNLRLRLPVGDEVPVVFLDTETTGLDQGQDRIIQLGMVCGLYSPSAKALHKLTGSCFCDYEDPGFPIPGEITQLTGITTEDVRGQRFCEESVARFLAEDPLVVAHNAWFDRPFFERRFPRLANLRWCCSLKEVSWREHGGFEGSGLGPLLMQAGYFFEGHRASDDCLALAWLLGHCVPEAFEDLVTSASAPSYLVEAWASPIDVKEDLKARRYRWDDKRRVWHTDGVRDLEAELDFLAGLYPAARSRAVIKEQTARDRHKKAGLPALVVR